MFRIGDRNKIIGIFWKPLVVERKVIWHKVEHKPDAEFVKFFTKSKKFDFSTQSFVDGI